MDFSHCRLTAASVCGTPVLAPAAFQLGPIFLAGTQVVSGHLLGSLGQEPRLLLDRIADDTGALLATR